MDSSITVIRVDKAGTHHHTIILCYTLHGGFHPSSSSESGWAGAPRLSCWYPHHLQWLFCRDLPGFWHKRHLPPTFCQLPEEPCLGHLHAPGCLAELLEMRALKRCLDELTFPSTARIRVNHTNALVSAEGMSSLKPRPVPQSSVYSQHMTHSVQEMRG